MKTATSTEQSTDNSWAFLNRPPLRFKKVLPKQIDTLAGVLNNWRDSALKRMAAHNVAFNRIA
ncbi:hypothetical protein RRF57_010533 [Xylaria bambusicola]|uniref:Uncharacterized protein n=1 Tax=Xylaria bambusicola TaxID=326684 RepID=A0AAN7Z2U4_9PEZI